MADKKIPEGVISRLFVYLKELTELSKVNIQTISSSELGDRANLSDAQVRKDLGYFGQFGVSGSGYNVQELKTALEKILGKDKTKNVAVVGVGRLGEALLSYPGFRERGLPVVVAFDRDPAKADKRIGDVPVRSAEQMAREVKNNKVSIGIIAVPEANAQEVADKMVEAGIECILNLAPVALNVPEKIKVKNVDFSRELETLSYFCA
ncbi:MAG: redox-sensing transcriptional repressor Rex [Candidatus Omnitrophota bacterium]